ncbi:tail fiber domain-containing protein [Roseisolibacter sp. H3M3-2]|uniref:tail fiber domain-containing protein n=1 Tax=Roseisolibacter sp. H3M3-2 TaxID=3031323 RepID=UPI0023DC0CA9|nr:tail fiber domain-containing protein [Roseisolibacter sp. H3M3-2]MDF1505603.1 tail fiber domain-containing protein [Roseisolibacter sp. H3M3-2]
MRPFRPILALAAAATLPTAAHAQKVLHACYVPASGTVYRIKEANTAQACLQPSHVAFSWTDGADAYAALALAVKTTDAAAGDVTGAFTSLTVGKLLGRALATTPPTDGQVLAWNASTSQWAPTTAPAGGGTTVHGQLTGLAADDHPQYLRLGNRVEQSGGFAVSTSGPGGPIPAAGTGARFMWYSGKRALRAGYVTGVQWDDANVGQYSTAFGASVQASGPASFAVGQGSIASGDAAMAAGHSSVASGNVAFAVGQSAVASGNASVAMGDGATASGAGAFALGTGASATALRGYAIGNGASAALGRSVAIGQDAKTMTGSEEGAVAIGRSAMAGGGQDPMALGQYSVATGDGALALGFGAKAQGEIAVALGWNSVSTANGSMALGPTASASANSAVALGAGAVASGAQGYAIGGGAKSSAVAAFAIGRSATASHDGAMVLSDNNIGTPAASSAANQLVARFAGGFRLRTSVNSATGCNLPAGSGVWDCTSDRAAKTAVRAVTGESILGGLRSLPVSTWEYRTERGVRHLGPMAQDFRAAFGLGADERSIGMLDASGVALAAAKALETRTADLRRADEALRRENAALRQDVAELRARLAQLDGTVAALAAQLAQQR